MSEIAGIARIDIVALKPLLLVRKGTLTINYITLNGKKIDLREDFRTLRVMPDKKGILEISYKASFKDAPASHEQVRGTAQNMIGPKGISLTNSWYPDVGGPYYYKLKVSIPKEYEVLSEAERVKKVIRGDAAEFSFDFPHPLDSINLAASDRFRVTKDEYKGIEIAAYLFTEDAALAGSYIEFTKKYIGLYEGLLGKFPYKRFSVVENLPHVPQIMPECNLKAPSQ